MPAPDPFSVVHVGAEEVQTSPAYRFDNSRREGEFALVIQRTVSGSAWFRDERSTQPVPAGHAMLFSHREATGYGYPVEASEPYRLRFLAFSATGVAELFDRLRQDFGSVVRMPDESEATSLFDEAIERYRKRQFRDRLQESELVYRLLIALYREQVQGTRTSDPIEFGHHYVRNHFRSPVNLKGVAQKCGVSREHFIREFSARYRESPGLLLRRLRLEHAKAMLTATALSVEEIALASGFTSSNTFCRAYRLRFGKSPGSARPRR
ncbi:MAG: AraC family transcriptional regulator [Verrucomicrobia bacterium]|nr:AraC family transcriptional regulator [Verrucomicrobiota bacterium]